jgi:DNA ligase D-like protein (predicted 3'-phosphoesterase)
VSSGGGYCRLVPATRFVVQLHDATALHFDLRIQIGEVLRSWAVPKGPSLDPAVRRLAVPVEDHDLSAGEFEGVHEGQSRGSGAVIIWDEGPAEVTRDKPGHLAFTLDGSKLAGGFALTQTGERRWILVKTRDAAARPGSDIVAERPASVRTGRTWQEVAARPMPLAAGFPPAGGSRSPASAPSFATSTCTFLRRNRLSAWATPMTPPPSREPPVKPGSGPWPILEDLGHPSAERVRVKLLALAK